MNQRASLSFTNPFFLGTPTALSVGLAFRSLEFRDQNDFNQNSWQFNLGGSYPLDEGETRIGTNYGFSNRSIDSFDRAANVLLQREDFMDSTTTSSVGLFWTRDTRDDVQFTRSGQQMNLNVELAGLGGTSNFLRFETGMTRFVPLKKWLGFESTFVFNTRAGYVLPFNSIADFDLPECGAACRGFINDSDDDAGTPGFVGASVAALSELDKDLELPLSERYFVGGINSQFQLRGYENAAVGPRRTRIVPMRNAGGTVFRAVNRNPFTTGPRCATEASIRNKVESDPNADLVGLPDDQCNDIDEKADFDNFDLTEVIGGNKAFVANFELQVPISEDYGITGIAFFDTGNSFEEDQSFLSDLRYSAGVGGRWLSPFGPIVLYLGFPLNPLEDEKGSVFEFSFGGGSF